MNLYQPTVSNALFNVPTMAEENITLNFDTRYEMIIQRNADICRLKHLVLEFDDQYVLNANNWKEPVTNISLEIMGGGSRLAYIPIVLLGEITTPTIINNKLIVSIPHYFSFDILLVALPYHELRLRIISTNNHDLDNTHISSFNVLATYIYYDTDERHRLTHSGHELLVHQLTPLETTRNTRQARVLIDNTSFTKGYFIHTPVNNIKHISLRLDGSDRFVYDEIMINMFCNKISDNLLYVPFVHSQIPNFMMCSRESFAGSLNSSRVRTAEMILEFNNECNFSICSLNGIFLRIMSGMIGADIMSSAVPRENTETTTFIYTPAEPRTSNQITWTEENKIIGDRNNECPISYVEFTAGCKYCCCSTCNVNYDAQTLKNFFASQRVDIIKCPTCRSNWTNYVVYTNVGE